jgi:sugar phosphate isomerase/epimerase
VRFIPGIQLYTVRDEISEDFAGTLRKVATIGYREVEIDGLYGMTPVQFGAMLADAGLRCRSGHLVFLGQLEIDKVIADALALGLQFLVAPVPWKRELSTVRPDPEGGPHAFIIGMLNSMTLDDWKWNADLLNKVGEQIRKAGLRFAYHNHNFEFRSYDGVIGFDQLVRLTEPDLVHFELDPGWVRVAGFDPVEVLTRLGNRTRLLHLRDFQFGFEKSTRLSLASAPKPAVAGEGAVGIDALLAVAAQAGVEGYYVEREPVAGNLESIRRDWECLRRKMELLTSGRD